MQGTARSKSLRATPVLIGLAVFLLLIGIFLDYPYQQIGGVAPTVTTLNGESYYTATVQLRADLGALTLKGVRFNFSQGIQENLSLPYGQFQGETSVTVPCPQGVRGGTGSCEEFLPQIQITFPDGSVEYCNRATVANGSMNYDPPASYPWFSAHTNPQVAVVLNAGSPAASLTLYVSE